MRFVYSLTLVLLVLMIVAVDLRTKYKIRIFDCKKKKAGQQISSTDRCHYLENDYQKCFYK